MQVLQVFKTPGVRLQHSLRNRILAGEFKPGARFPTLKALTAEFGVSHKTVMRVVRALQRGGFVESRGWRGTFVAQRLPFLHQFALVFASSYPAGATLSRAIVALTNAARQVAAEEGWEFRSYNLEWFDPASHAQSELLTDARRHEIGGAVFFNFPDLELMRAFAGCDVPFAVVRSDSPVIEGELVRKVKGRITEIVLDDLEFAHKAVEWMRARKRRRVAVLSSRLATADACGTILRAAGIQTRPCWLLETGFQFRQAASLVELLLHWPSEDRPDGLIVADDNLVEPACSALAEAGVTLGRELDLVAHTNWPAAAPALPGVCRLGYDFAFIIRQAVAAIQAGRSQKHQIPWIRMSPVFDVCSVPVRA